jgi:hypothetical protein
MGCILFKETVSRLGKADELPCAAAHVVVLRT